MHLSCVFALVSDTFAVSDISRSGAMSEAICVLGAMMIAVLVGRVRSVRTRSSRPRSQSKEVARERSVRTRSSRPRSQSKEVADMERYIEAQCRRIAVAVRKGRAVDIPQIMSSAPIRNSDKPESNDVEAQCCELLDACLRACVANRDFEKALTVYDQVRYTIGDGSSSTWSLLLYCAVEACHFQSCELFIERLLGKGQCSSDDFVNIVRFSATVDNTSCFSNALSIMNAKGYTPDVIARNRALGICIGMGRFQFVEAVLAGTIGVPVDVVYYNTLIRLYGQNRQLLRCFELLADMRAQGLVPNETTFGVLLSVCVRNKNIKAAERAFYDLKASGLEVNRVHYTTLLQGFALAGRLKDANAILNEMTASRSTRPDNVTYGAFVKALAGQGRIDESLRLVENMHEQGIVADNMLFNQIIDGFCSAPMSPQQVLRTFDRLVELGLEPSIATASVLLKALAHQKGWYEAAEFLSRLEQRFGLKPARRLFDQLARACRRAGRCSDARMIEIAAREAAH